MAAAPHCQLHFVYDDDSLAVDNKAPLDWLTAVDSSHLS